MQSRHLRIKGPVKFVWSTSEVVNAPDSFWNFSRTPETERARMEERDWERDGCVWQQGGRDIWKMFCEQTSHFIEFTLPHSGSPPLPSQQRLSKREEFDFWSSSTKQLSEILKSRKKMDLKTVRPTTGCRLYSAVRERLWGSQWNYSKHVQTCLSICCSSQQFSQVLFFFFFFLTFCVKLFVIGIK